MEDPNNIVQFIRVGGLFTSVIVIACTWVAIQALNGFLRRLGHRFTDQRLRIQQVGTVGRFLIYVGVTVTCLLLSVHLTKELMLALGGSIAVMLYVLDVRYEKALETDVTERVLEGFREADVSPPAILHRNVAASSGLSGARRTRAAAR